LITPITDYAVEVEGVRTPDEVLDRLDSIISQKSPFVFMAPTAFPSRSGTGRIEVGKNRRITAHAQAAAAAMEAVVMMAVSKSPPIATGSRSPQRFFDAP
jgi:D-serine deaminase-like pyridoxal phosphate-dependent protein